MPLVLDDIDNRLMNSLQKEVPLVEKPFCAIGDDLNLPENAVIERIKRLRNENVVRHIGAIFDGKHLGYKSSLVAMRLPSESLDASAQVINRYPGVSHNYARDGFFNLWFTIAVPPNEHLEDTVGQIARLTNPETYRLLPTTRMFKIGVNFDMVNKKGAANIHAQRTNRKHRKSDNVEVLSDLEIQLVRELQEDLALESQPYAAMAQRANISQWQMFRHANSFKERGIMRRYSAILNHRRAGFNANAMTVWKVPPHRSVEVGNIMARSPWISHCYERPTFPDWEYSHFTMIHASVKEQCETVAQEISEATGISEYMLLYSTHEYKKTRVKYFCEAQTDLVL